MDLKAVEPLTLAEQAAYESFKQSVDIYHPGYDDSTPLLTFSTPDSGGISYTVAYYACCIVAGNKFPGDSEGLDPLEKDDPFLSTSSSPKEPRIQVPKHIVPAGKYYFHIPTHKGRKPYPIVPHFNQWVFPDVLPKPWRELLPYNRAPAKPSPPGEQRRYDPRSTCCSMTGSTLALEHAHFVPRGAQYWLLKNDMRSHIKGGDKSTPVHDSYENKVYLSKAVHFLWDENNLIFVPKPDASQGGKYRLACHAFIRPPSVDSALELISKYHNVALMQVMEATTEFMFARFAWALFTRLTLIHFLDGAQTGQVFSVLMRQPRGKTVNKMLPFPQLPKLGTKATRTDRGEKRGAEDLDDAGKPLRDSGYEDVDFDVDPISECNYGSDVDPLEPGDYCPSHYSPSVTPSLRSEDESEPPSKRSRLSSVSSGARHSGDQDSTRERSASPSVPPPPEVELAYVHRDVKDVKREPEAELPRTRSRSLRKLAKRAGNAFSRSRRGRSSATLSAADGDAFTPDGTSSSTRSSPFSFKFRSSPLPPGRRD